MLFRSSYIILLTIVYFHSFSQTSTDAYSRADQITLSTPDSISGDLDKLSSYFSEKLVTRNECLRGIYTWLTGHISYAVEDMYNLEIHKDNKEIIKKALLRKKAVCQGYCEIFNELCRRCKIRAIIIQGYAKMDGKLINLPHAWVAAESDNGWRLFDPTWGAGYVREDRFTKKFSEAYFMMTPEKSILNRFPFDPLFQFLEKSVSPKEFEGLNTDNDKGNLYFHFPDSLEAWSSSDDITRLGATCRRLETAGATNRMSHDYYTFQEQQLEIMKTNKATERNNAMVKVMNTAVDKMNEAVILYNKYVEARNKQFRGDGMTDQHVREMVSRPDSLTDEAIYNVNQVASANQELTKSKEKLHSQINELKTRVKKEKEFVEKYCKTPKLLRRRLFYQ